MIDINQIQTGLPFYEKGFLQRQSRAYAQLITVWPCFNMALRMVCRAISSRCVSAVPRAAATQCSVPSSLLRHAAGSLTRPAWRSEATTLISLRSLNGSTIARSALTDLLQDEIEYEKENYQPPEVSRLALSYVVHSPENYAFASLTACPVIGSY